ncbi:transcriptional repressor LexA [[Limnothrix rosea] IAM M-220]|uniref:transcriptional repressor LexA n=1 Tax=[Limnothrix rosea] IAM M-220 TaxID=454133 RepID=UPI000959257C|nr:transcriptional repressor LexA [[Limnothrix rosea] IAM M-220]OKH17759.1 repressor LexA [[Limnothrix rosea] IAM M-220]
MEKLTKAQKELHDWLVEYIREHQHSPSIRQMMAAMKLKSPAPIQSRLERLRKKKYIDWIDGQARTLKILYPPQNEGVQILGSIAAGGLVEPFTDDQTDKLMLAGLDNANCYALRVTGDSMIEDFITEGDFAIMEKVIEPERVKNGSIVAARVEGYGTTLKHFHREHDYILLKPANSNYQPIKTNPTDVQIQGVLIGVWRSYN